MSELKSKTGLTISIAVVLILIILVWTTNLNNSKNLPPNSEQARLNSINPANSPEINSQQIEEVLNNIDKVEGQKIKSISDRLIILENDQKIEFAQAKDINCKIGDIISDYDTTKQALVCLRQNPKTGQKDSFFSTLFATGAGVVAGSLIGGYINSKIFANNINLRRDDYGRYMTPNGGTFQRNNLGQFVGKYQNSSSQNSNNRTGGRIGGGWFGGLFGGDSGSDSKSGSGSKSSGSGSHIGSGGVSSGKVGSGGG